MKFDDVEFHLDDARSRGQPHENAFAHIGFMLSWLIRHGLVRADFLPAGTEAGLQDGSIPPADLEEICDGKLVDSMLTPDGVAFLRAYYSPAGYLRDFEQEFGGAGYDVAPDAAHQVRIDARIDEAYRASRSAPAAPEVAAPPSDERLPARTPEHASLERLAGAGARPIDVGDRDHARTDLEERIAAVLARGRRVRRMSSDGRRLGAGFKRGARTLGLEPRLIFVATAIESDGMTAEVHEVRGVPAGRLAEVFGRELEKRMRGPWRDERVAGVPVRATIFKGAPGGPRQVIWFAIDGYLIYAASADPADLELAVSALPAALERE